MPIQLPKSNGNGPASTPQTPPPTPASANSLFGQPDVIPTAVAAAAAVSEPRSSVHSVEHVPPPVEFSGGNNSNRSSSNENGNSHRQVTDIDESLYANVEPRTATAKTTAVEAPSVASAAAVEVTPQGLSAALDDVEENIYENAQTIGGGDLAECIDDTGIRAIALYDYEAAADDEISFDPEDLITHIEQVILGLGLVIRSLYLH